jgi:cellulose synthase/poly-beta-1,6-N-acetylglucosamine synthase-like glycosyltransferase
MIIFYYVIILAFLTILNISINDLRNMNHRKNYLINSKIEAKNPLVSILVPARNEEKILKGCIDNLLKSNYKNYEILIIAGGSDGTFNEANKISQANKKITVIEQGDEGKSGALNKGLRKAKGDIIVLVDADTLVEQEWLGYLIAPIIDGRASATSGNPYPYECNWVTFYHSMCSLFRIFRGKKSLFGAATVAIKREIIEKTGKFNENAHAADDLIFDRNVKALGYNIESVEKAKLKTDFSTNFIDFLKIETRFNRSLFQYYFNSKPIIKQILDPKKFIFHYFTFIYSICMLLGIFLFFLPDKPILLPIKIIYVFILSIEFIRCSSKPFILFFHTKNRFWLRYSYVTIIFLIASYFYTTYGVLTFYKSSKFFSGPRKLHKPLR